MDDVVLNPSDIMAEYREILAQAQHELVIERASKNALIRRVHELEDLLQPQQVGSPEGDGA